MQMLRSQFAGSLAKSVDHHGMLFVGAVGEVQPGHVHTQQHEIANHLLGVADRANGANNLGAAP